MSLCILFFAKQWQHALLYICIGKTADHNCPPSSAEPVYEEVDGTGNVMGSHNIEMKFNEAYGPMIKDSILTSANSAYGQI